MLNKVNTPTYTPNPHQKHQDEVLVVDSKKQLKNYTKNTTTKRKIKYEDDLPYAQPQCCKNIKLESRSTKNASKIQNTILDVISLLISSSERTYPANFSTNAIFLLDQSYGNFLSVFTDKENVLNSIQNILSQSAGIIMNKPDDLRLLLELGILCQNINNCKSTRGVNTFVKKIFEFFNDHFHSTKQNNWFKCIKDFLANFLENEGVVINKDFILTKEHIYQVILATYNISNQQELSSDNTDTSTIATALIQAKPETYSRKSIQQEIHLLVTEANFSNSVEIAAFLSRKFFDLDDLDKKSIMQDLVSFFNDTPLNVEMQQYLDEYYLYLLCRIAEYNNIADKSLEDICDGISEFFANHQIEFTSENIHNILKKMPKLIAQKS